MAFNPPYNGISDVRMVWNVPVPVMYQGMFYEVDVIKNITNVNSEQLNKYIVSEIERLQKLNEKTIIEKVLTELKEVKTEKTDGISKEELEELRDNLQTQIDKINKRIDDINAIIAELRKDLEAFKNLPKISVSDSIDVVDGVDGKSAYQIAIDGGYKGTEAEWLESLKGTDGTPGSDGKSAYQIAVAGGYDGTEAEWLESLRGKDGKAGKPGESITEEQINEIITKVTENVTQKFKEGGDVESPLNNLSEFIQLLVITKRLIIDTSFMMSTPGKLGEEQRNGAISTNINRIVENIKRLNQIEIMSVVNPLVDDINEILKTFLFTKSDGSKDRLIPFDIIPNYVGTSDVANLESNRQANSQLSSQFNVGNRIGEVEAGDVVAQKQREEEERRRQEAEEKAREAAATAARIAAEAETLRLKEERLRQEAEAAATAASNAEEQARLKALLDDAKAKLNIKLQELTTQLDANKTYKDILNDDQYKFLRQLIELYSVSIAGSGSGSNKYQVGGGYNNYYGGFGFYQIGGNFTESTKKVRDTAVELGPNDFKQLYTLWNSNQIVSKGESDMTEYLQLLSRLNDNIPRILGEPQVAESKLQEWREDILKIPGIIVKVTDHYLDIIDQGERYDSNVNNGYVSVVGDTCLEVGSNCLTEPKKYGPFRYSVGPANNKNPSNKQIFDYLVDENKYNLTSILSKDNQHVKLFGYGYSGSGKTYTLLQGATSPEEKSLFVQTLELIRDSPSLSLDDSNPISVDIFYPKEDNKGEALWTSGGLGKEMDDKLETFVKKLIENKDGSNTSTIIETLRGIETTLLDYLLVLPTSNNPKSSRAFTIITINLSNRSSITFIDLPGLEKKVDMIRDHYYPTKSSEEIKSGIQAKQNEELTSNVIINGFGGFYDIKGSITVKKASGGLGGNKIDKFTYNTTINTKNYTESLIIGLKNSYLQKNAFDNFQLKLKNGYLYTDLLKEYLIKLICFTNYQYELVEGYTYTLPNDSEIEDFIKNFEDAFLGDGNKKTSKSTTASEQVYKDIMENVFNLNYEDTNIKINLDAIKGTFVSPILDILYALIKYLSADRNVRIGAGKVKDTDKRNAILLFMIMFTQFTLEQGDAIVTSLEHLLFEFLNQIPDGIDKFNATDGVTKFIVTGTGSEARYTDRSFTISSSSGMTETVTSKYLPGMNRILGITKDSRFVNLLTILRHYSKEDHNKRCQGAKDTLDFGKTLVQSNEKLCGVNPELTGELSGLTSQIKRLGSAINEIKQAQTKPLTDKVVTTTLDRVKAMDTGVAFRKYRKNRDEGCSLM